MADLDYADVCIVCGADFGVIPDSLYEQLHDSGFADVCVCCGILFGVIEPLSEFE